MTEPARRAQPFPGARARGRRGDRAGATLGAAGWLLAALAAGLPPAQAASECWRIDPRNSEVRFQLVALGAIPLHGRFERLSGHAWRGDDDDRIRVRVEVDAGSLSMASAHYQAWARGPEFFDVRRHPRVVFASDPLAPTVLSGGGELAGRLTVRGIERGVKFDLLAPGCDGPVSSCRLHVEGRIRRADFGMRSRRIALSDRVALDLRLAVDRDDGACPADPSAALE